MNQLRVETITFSEIERRRWISGDASMLERSSASAFLKRVIGKKHRVRPKRFFGEAFVASHMDHEEGYYSSFKWLTSAGWAAD